MLYKLFVSVIAAFTIVNGVTASATPVARDDDGFPPPDIPPVTVDECDTGSMQCCDTYTSADNPDVVLLSNLLDLALDPDLGVGVNCIPIFPLSTQCDNTPLCCDNVDESGLLAVGCSPLDTGL